MDRLADQIARQKRVRETIMAARPTEQDKLILDRFLGETASWVARLHATTAAALETSRETLGRSEDEVARLTRCLRVIRAHVERGTISVTTVERALSGERL